MNFSPAPLWRSESSLEVAAYGVGIGRDLRVDAADAANERHECRELIRGVRSLVFVQQRIGAPDAERRKLRPVGLQGINSALIIAYVISDLRAGWL